jgi:hypothetical protein
MAFKLPDLPYDFAALEPHIDARTMEIHYGKHHATYVAKLNAALEKHPALAQKPVEDLLKSLDTLPTEIRTAVRNRGGGNANHSLFSKLMAPGAGQERHDEPVLPQDVYGPRVDGRHAARPRPGHEEAADRLRGPDAAHRPNLIAAALPSPSGPAKSTPFSNVALFGVFTRLKAESNAGGDPQLAAILDALL